MNHSSWRSRAVVITLASVVFIIPGASAFAALSLSQSNVTLSGTQAITINVMGGGTDYYVSSNSNPASVLGNMNGSTLTLTSTGKSGTASISICSILDTTNCGTATATVSDTGGATTSNSSLSLNPSSLTMTPGATQSVNISGNGSYFVSANSNSAIASYSQNGSVLTINALSQGNTTITVCQNSGGCGNLSVTVNSTGGSTGGSISFSQPNPSISVGQTITITVSGGSGTYSLSSVSNPSIVNASLSGNTLTLNRLTVGSATINVCESGGSCSTLSIPFGATGAVPTTTTPTTNTTTPVNSIIFPTSLLSQIQTLEGQIALMLNQLAQLKATVQALISGSSVMPSTVTTATNGTTTSYKFYLPLSIGDSGNEVRELQKKLIAGGFLSGEITGYFGLSTENAVKAFQKANGLSPLGNVGPGTRAALNK